MVEIETLEQRRMLNGGQVTVTVPGTAGPWLAGPAYGVGDETPPTIVAADSTLPFHAGDSIAIQYLSGQVSCSADSGYVDANGMYWPGNIGSTGKPFPSFYFSSANLVELVGVFTDSSGTFVGGPFAIGDSLNLTIPAGATHLQLGANDDYYEDNGGSWQLSISENVGLLSASISNTLPIVVAPGDTITVPLTITNNGSSDLSGSATISYWLSKDETVDPSVDVPLGTFTDSLSLSANGGTATPKDQVDVPDNFPAKYHWGPYQLLAQVTPDDGLGGGAPFTSTGPAVTQVFSHVDAPAAATLWETAVNGDNSTFAGSDADLITVNEGARDYVYWDTKGHPTIGIGVNLDQYGEKAIASMIGANPASAIEADVINVKKAWKSAHPNEKLSGSAKDYSAFFAQNPDLFSPIINDAQASSLFHLLLPKYEKLASRIIGKATFASLPSNVEAVAVDIAFNRPATLTSMAGSIRAGDYASAAWDMMNVLVQGGGTWADAVSTRVTGDGGGKPGDFHVLFQSLEDEEVSYVSPLEP